MHTKHICATSWAQIVAKGFFNMTLTWLTSWFNLSRRRSKVSLADGQETRSKILQGFVELVQREESCRTLLSHATWWWWFPGRVKSTRWGWGTYQAMQGRSWKQPSSLDFIVNWSIAGLCTSHVELRVKSQFWCTWQFLKTSPKGVKTSWLAARVAANCWC